MLSIRHERRVEGDHASKTFDAIRWPPSAGSQSRVAASKGGRSLRLSRRLGGHWGTRAPGTPTYLPTTSGAQSRRHDLGHRGRGAKGGGIGEGCRVGRGRGGCTARITRPVITAQLFVPHPRPLCNTAIPAPAFSRPASPRLLREEVRRKRGRVGAAGPCLDKALSKKRKIKKKRNINSKRRIDLQLNSINTFFQPILPSDFPPLDPYLQANVN